MHPLGVARRTILRMQQLYSYLAGLAAIGGAAGGVAGQYYQGYAYAADDGRLLYREAHWLYTDNGVEHRLVVYSCPDGAPFVRKRVDTAPGAATPHRSGQRASDKDLSGNNPTPETA